MSFIQSRVVGVSMVIRYTDQYPDEAPNICFVDAVNISEDDLVSLTQMICVGRFVLLFDSLIV